MGTSVSQRSPKTTNWSVVAATYSSDQVPIERIAREVWRAATNQPEGDITLGLAAPIVAECLNVALDAVTREGAATSASLAIAFSGEASLAADIAQRAAVRSVGMSGDRALNYAKALFSEAGNYLVSRDLPGFVGPSGRARTVSEAISLKGAIRKQIEGTVASASPPPAQREAWGAYVRGIVRRLTERE